MSPIAESVDEYDEACDRVIIRARAVVAKYKAVGFTHPDFRVALANLERVLEAFDGTEIEDPDEVQEQDDH